ncbi:TRAP transporter substrate-binding protein [Stappia sp.]|uniref:TRAP transporter substrate-binding protein n=1 Tax=Stappia sp. TaxID=1870903 RepID=UPI003A99FEDE
MSWKTSLSLATALVTLAAVPAVAKTLEMTSVYPGSFPIVGDIGKDIGNRVSKLTGGDLTFTFNEPGALVPAPEAWDAVSTGAVDAAWYSTGFAQGVIKSAAMFTSVPFGPEAPEYLAWYYKGGGKEIWDDIAAKHNIVSIVCTTTPPEASGWFRKPIDSLDDLKGMKMRFYGLGARVMEKLGVQTLTLPVGDTVPALELGTIDAAEVSMPALDQKLGMQDYAKHYYFPGWHQQTSLYSLIINKDVWDGLSENEQAAINEVCRSAVAESIAWGEAIQFEALSQLKEKGVVMHKWSPEILAAMEAAWLEVVEEMKAEDEDFARVWKSYSDFRTNYAEWRDLGYMR